MTQAIHPAQIESELTRIWGSFEGTNKMRACLFNLLIYSKKCKKAEYLNHLSQKVIQKFPSRIIFITYEEEVKKTNLETKVSVISAEGNVACDLIEIDVSISRLREVPFIVLAHLLPDLPIHLMQGEDPCIETPILDQLQALANRIIFDSEWTENLPLFAQSIIHLKESKNPLADYADLNWARIKEWRDLFASLFKSDDELKILRQTKSILISFNRTSNQSIYFQSWIAAQLGWESKGNQGLIFSYTSDSAPLNITLHPTEMENLTAGGIVSVEIQTNTAHEYLLERNREHPEEITIKKSSPECCLIPSHFIFAKEIGEQSTVREICQTGTSQHYLNTLKMVASHL